MNDDRCLLCGARDSELPEACLAVQRGAMASEADAPAFGKAALCVTDKLWAAVQAERERRTHAAGVRAVVRMFSEAGAASAHELASRWPLAKDAWIQTYSGLVFRPFDPDPSMVRIGDISHALSNINRFNGHARFPYSVAAHSIYVASRIGEMTAGELHRRLLLPSSLRRLQLLGLLHDAAEAYFGDIVSPIKRHVSVFKTIEAKILATIFEALNLEPPSVSEQATLDEFDLRALVTEKRDLHQPEPQAWEIDKPPFDERIVETSWRHVREKFGLLYTHLAR